MRLSDLVRKIKPYVLGWITETGGGAGPYAPTPHSLDSAHHSGSLSQYVHISVVRSIAAQHTFAPAAEQAPFLLSANAQGQTVVGFQADKLDKDVVSGDGLIGGGALTGNLTLSVNVGTGLEIVDDEVRHASGALDLHTGYLLVNGDRSMTGTLQAQSILPIATDTYDLGSSTKLWRKGWLSEMEAILFVEHAIQVIGGYFWIPHASGTLAEDVDNSQTTIDFGTAMTPNDFVVLRSSLNVEYLQVGSLVSGTTYNITRNVDGSGANAWPQGHVFVVLGTLGDGRIELDAQTGGPRISVISQGATYNAQTEQVRIGDLNGVFGISSEAYGIGIGDYAGNKYLRYDSNGGMVVRGKIYADEGELLSLVVKGQLTVSTNGRLASGATGYMAGIGWWLDFNAGTPRFRIGDPANEYLRWTGSVIEIAAAGGNLTIGAAGLVCDLNDGVTVKHDKTDSSTPKRVRFLSNDRAALQGNAFLHQYSTDPTHSRMVMNHWDDTASGAGNGPTHVYASEIWDATNPKRLIGAYSSPAVGSDQGTLKYAISTDGSQIHPDFPSNVTTWGIAGLDWIWYVKETAANDCRAYLNGDTLRMMKDRTLASAAATGGRGSICWDSSYLYVCVATNTWKRVALSTW